jgi:[lysine-biosynthesis-protein LysW]---L-2-aminoadipate ligase
MPGRCSRRTFGPVSRTEFPPSVAIVAWPAHASNPKLVDGLRRLGVRVGVVSPRRLDRLPRSTVVLVRLDVLPTLDGVEPGIAEVRRLELRGYTLLNRADALVTVHDKLATAAALARAGLPHPRTGHVATVSEPLPLEPPLVVKPRFGSWGRDVFRCVSALETEACLAAVSERPWFLRHGALVQELVSGEPRDLRVIVAGGRVVGAATRVPAAGQWRTNVSLGARLEPADPPPAARELAAAAAAAVGIDLVGVDLLQRGDEWIVLELNGAVEFDERYSLPGGDVYGELVQALRFGADGGSVETPMQRMEAGLMVAGSPRRSER